MIIVSWLTDSGRDIAVNACNRMYSVNVLISRVIDQLSDGLFNIRTLIFWQMKGFCISVLRQFVNLLAYYLQSKDELAMVSLQANEISVRKLRRYDQFLDFCLIEAGEQRKATKFGRQVLLSFPSQSSKCWVLLHFANIIARRHSQAIT